MNSSAGECQLVSLVIPLCNEEEVIEQLFSRLSAMIATLPAYRWELILVDDGSTDRTVAEVTRHSRTFPAALRLIKFSRNFGHQPALTAGIRAAAGAAVVCLDADLQDPPELVGSFLEKFEEGFDVVYAVRAARVEGWAKNLAYKMFYRLFRSVAEVPIPLDAGDFSLMTKRAARLVTAMSEQDIFLRGLRSWIGFRQIGVPYDRPTRSTGETKYRFGKLLNLAASAFFGFSFLPLRLATTLGFLTVLLSLGYTAFALAGAVFFRDVPRGWASVVGVISFIGGAQLISIGILGEYIGRIYKQTRGRPLFVIAEECELNKDSDFRP